MGQHDGIFGLGIGALEKAEPCMARAGDQQREQGRKQQGDFAMHPLSPDIFIVVDGSDAREEEKIKVARMSTLTANTAEQGKQVL